MSNLSDIGFPVKGNEDINALIENLLKDVKEIRCLEGSYLKFADASSDAEVYFQMNGTGELLGFNPYFNGKSKRSVLVKQTIARDYSELDGAFYAQAIGDDDYPFVFDAPDFHTTKIQLPRRCQIQLNGFATNDFRIFENEAAHLKSQDSENFIAPQTFVPSGLFRRSENGETESVESPPAHGIIAGNIKEFELKMNQFSGEKFYWFLVETLGGEIDIVADANLIFGTPKIGSIVQGRFWLTGKILETADFIK